MVEGNLLIEPIVKLGPVVITSTVVTTWVIMAVIWLLAWLVSRRLRIEPAPLQAAVEGVVTSIEAAYKWKDLPRMLGRNVGDGILNTGYDTFNGSLQRRGLNA